MPRPRIILASITFIMGAIATYYLFYPEEQLLWFFQRTGWDDQSDIDIAFASIGMLVLGIAALWDVFKRR